jgi:DNA-binding transcriptional MerR regulator
MSDETEAKEIERMDLADAPPPPSARERPVAAKEYYSISEVCDLVGLRPHVLRYWETQFPVLNPSKNRSGNRVYQRKEIKLILYVKHLLYDEKYTVEGAKQKLEQLRKGGELQTETKKALDKQMVALLRAEMKYLAELLTPTKATNT